MRPHRLRALVLTGTAALLLAACGDDPDPTVDDAPAEEEADAAETDAGADDGSGDDADGAPTPDADLVADPCEPHEERVDETFIELAAPVDGQAVDDDLDLVGCSNVFEANVQWRLEADGEVLDDGFTTAECGSGCVGAFEEQLALDAADGHEQVTLTVFAPSMAEGEGDAEEPSVSVTLQR